MKKIINILLISLLLSCSAEKKLAKLVQKHPELVSNDTITITDTIVTSSVKSDTILYNQPTTDTVIIKKEKLTIKYFNTRDSIFIEGKCDPDTIIKEIPVKVNTINPVKYETKTPTWAYMLLGILLFIIIIIVAKKYIWS